MDQASAPFFSNHIYFYSSNPEIPNSDKTNHLKKSLSETLTTFYPLAGRLVDNRQVDCSDGGVPFSEAEANCQLSQAIHNPNAKQLYKFIPREPKDSCMAIQTTYFRCGGVAVAISITHKLADAASFFSFPSSWSAFARNDTAQPPPLFNAAAYFPPMNIPGVNIKTVNPVNEDIAARIFTLPPSKIALLRETYAAAAGHRPTRMEAVSAFIWTRFISTTAIKPNRNIVYTVRHTVNLRGRVDDLALPDNLFGNILGVSTANVTAEDGGGELVMKFRRAIKAAMGSGVVAEFRESDKQMNLMKKVRAGASNGEPVIFSNLCGFSVYETDFGWGKPVWVASPGFLYKNTVVFNDAKSGGGMEVLITLNKDMEKFEADLNVQMLKSNL